jgi:soluble lytic murein transglycosylase-like protein
LRPADSIKKFRPWAVVVVAVLAAASSPNWCPEVPLLASVPVSVLRANLESTEGEVTALLGNLAGWRGAEDAAEITLAVEEASRRNGVPPELFLAVIEAESSFRRRAVSSKGAVGLMQLMPRTAAEVAAQLKIPWSGEASLNDPGLNITMGAFYLSKQLGRFRDLDIALAAYNRGPSALPGGTSESWRGETGHYVRRVRSLLERQAEQAPARQMGEPDPFKLSAYLSF